MSGLHTIASPLRRLLRSCFPAWRHLYQIVVTAIFGVVLSFGSAFLIYHWATRAAELEFEARASNVAFTLQAGINDYFSKILALHALFDASETGVSRHEFTVFARDILRGQTAILSVSWIPRVTREQRPALEAAAAAEGVTEFRIKEIATDGSVSVAGDKDEYFPVYYTTEQQTTARVLGLDLKDASVREDTLRRARDGDTLAASPVIELHSGNGDRRGFFVLSPVYKKGLPHQTVEERRRNIEGFVQGVFQVHTMVEDTLAAINAPVDIYVFAPESGGGMVPLNVYAASFANKPAEAKPLIATPTGLHWVKELKVADLPWTLALVLTATAGMTSDLMGWLMLAVGLAVTGLIVAFMSSSARHSQKLLYVNRRVSELAQTDALTHLANRRAFMERLGGAFAETGRGGPPFALLYVDLDHFKDVNDTLGHATGDLLLQQAAERLKGAVRARDLVARFGGDEFAVLQTDAKGPISSGTLAAKIIARLGEPYQIDGNEIHITASTGIAQCAPGLTTPEAAMMQADLALYRAKEDGRNCFRFHTEELDLLIQNRVSIGEDLRVALDRGEFQLFYQPQVDITSGEIVGFEALARWHHPRHGPIAPSVFVPIAEKTGSIVALGKWVFEEACRQLRIWEDEGIAPRSLAVNLSAVQCRRPELERDMRDSLERWAIDPGRIEIELTETVLLEATQGYGDIIGLLRALGVRIAIDDFGTGYSSLNYLTKYPVDRLKIAQELVFDVTKDSRRATVVRLAIRLAEELGMDSIAEGVETAGQALFLVSAGCKHAQGFYYGRPADADATRLLLKRKHIVPAGQSQGTGRQTAA